MWMAGVWEEHAEHGQCYSMITTTPNAAMERIHNRMPVILPFAKTDEFLNGDDPVDLLAPYNGDLETPECESPLKVQTVKVTPRLSACWWSASNTL
ncbi:MAG: putative SOS response-associated peptidase YedK [Verrucomicrobiales bacterium]|jgi:putative SOS response-associated peptidase YedK